MINVIRKIFFSALAVSLPLFAQPGQLTTVKDSLLSYASAVPTMHRVSFKLSTTGNGTTTGLPADGKIRLVFPASGGYDLSNADMASSGDPAVLTGGFLAPIADGDSMTLTRDFLGNDVPADAEVVIWLALVSNPSSRRTNDQLIVRTMDNSNNIIDSGVSNYYHIDGAITSYNLTMSGSYQVAGIGFDLVVSNAQDEFGHPAVDEVAIAATSGGGAAPDGTRAIFNNIIVKNGNGSATQVLFKKEIANVTLQARSTRGIIRIVAPTQFSVWHNPNITHLKVSGEPTAVVSGTAFADAIKVTAYDPYGNLADSYAKWVSFDVTLTDANKVLPAPYKFETVSTDDGQHSFSGSEFVLKKTGVQRIIVKDADGLADTTEAITVTAAAISNFSIQVNGGSAVTAGTEFPIAVTTAVDAAGNPASGTVTLAFMDAVDNHKSPSGVSAILVPITVVNGSGSANSKLFKVETNLQLFAVAGGISKTTAAMMVLPATAAELQISGTPGFPDTLSAGQNFGADSVSVRVVDSFGNLQNNFSGSVYFTSTDNQAVLPFTAGNQKAIPLGAFKFPGTGFTLKTAGNQTITVRSGTLSKISPSVLVQSTVINSFSLSVASTQIAGLQFPLTVSNARDQYGNLTTGVIVVTATTGGNEAPNHNASATLSNISVVNGLGYAAQVLVRSEAVILRGSVQGNAGASPQTATITVNPGLISYFVISGTPTRIASGAYFPAGVLVKAFDAFGNLKTNYTGTISFSSTDAAAYLPSAYTFTAAELGVHQYTGTNQFRLSTPGVQTVLVRDTSVSTAMGQAAIEVSSLIITRVYSDNATVSRGQQNALVKMDVLNSATKALTNLQAGLTFTNSGTAYNDDYTVTREDNITSIAAGGTTTLEFQVAVRDDAAMLSMTISGTATGKVDTLVVTDSDGASTTDSWLVQSEARLQVTSITVGAETIHQGQAGVIVSCIVANIGKATANLTAAGLEFLLNNTTNAAASFSVVPFNDNVALLAGEQSATLRYYISAVNTASIGAIYVYQNVNYTDANSSLVSSLRSTVYDTFNCVAANVLTITEMTPTRTTVTAGQTAEWAIYVGVKNSGDLPIILSFSNTKTYLRIRKTTNDYTSSYTITQPTAFEDGTTTLNGGVTKRMRFGIPKTGSELGVMTIAATVEATDGTKAADASGSFEVQSPANVRIAKIFPSQAAVTVNDVGYAWKVAVVLENSGGSEAALSFDSLYTDLIQTPKILKLVRPTTLQRYGSSLKAGQTDTLIYKVAGTANTTAAQLLLDAKVRYTVANTNTVVDYPSTTDVRGTVQLQMPSNFVIDRVRVSRKPVTQGRSNWWVTVIVSNQAEGSSVNIDLADTTKTYVQLRDAGGLPIDYYFRLPGGLSAAGTRTLAAGKTDSLIFQIKSAGSKTGPMTVISQITAVETNRAKTVTKMATGPLADNVVIQSKALISFQANSLTPAYVSPGETKRYQIIAINDGISPVVLDPVSTKIEFSDGINTYSARLDPAFGNTLSGAGKTIIAFNMNTIAETFAAGAYFPSIVLKGTENGYAYEKEFKLNSTTTVGTAKTLTIQSLNCSPTTTVTAGQSKSWRVSMTLANNGSNTLRLNGNQLTFFLSDADISGKFAWTTPNVFSNSSVFLRGKSTQTLNFDITGVSASAAAGSVMISGKIAMTDSAQATLLYNDETKANNSAYVTVQTPAVLELTKINISQTKVTRGQSSLWNIRLGVKNSGGSKVEVQPAAGSSIISFSKGSANFDLQSPTAFMSGDGLQLAGGQEDSLQYTVKKVNGAAAVIGSCDIAAVIAAKELNSDRLLSTQTPLKATVLVQDSAKVRVDTLVVDLPADSTVNSAQQYHFKARVTNVGNGETVRALYVQLFSKEGLSSILPVENGGRARIDTLAAGQSKWTSPGFLVQAKSLELGYVTEHFHGRIIETLSENTGAPVPILPALQAADTSKTIYIQKPGVLEIVQIIPSVDSVSVSSPIDWSLKAVVRNTGQSTLLLAPPTAADIEVTLPGYAIIPPVPTQEELRLTGGETDTLLYTVDTTGPNSGTAVITAKFKAGDENDPSRTVPTAIKQKEIKAVSNSGVRITATYIAAEANHRVDEGGVVHVNTGQNFRIGVEVENYGGQDLRNILIGLHAPTSALINGAERKIESLKTGSMPIKVFFDVTAAGVENLAGEQFTAKVNDAEVIDGSKAIVKPSTDSTAYAKIYNAAALQIYSVRNLAPNTTQHVSFGQVFQVEAVVKNLGSEPVQDVKLRMDVPPDSANKVLFDAQIITIPGEITANDTAKAVFTVTASSRVGRIDLIASVSNSKARNTNQPATVQHDGEKNTTYAVLEKGAQLQVLKVFTSVDEISAGDKSSTWRINVTLVNNGQSAIQLTDIEAANIKVRTEGEPDDGYKITAGSLVRSGGLRLPGGGVPDTLEYFVSQNGDLAGSAEITAKVQGFDVNLGVANPETVQQASGKDTLSVNSLSWVRIDLASAQGRQSDESGNWLVNRGQIYEASVAVETGELGGVDSVKVELTSNGLSKIEPAVLMIPRLNSASKDTVVFTVTADASWSQKLAEKKEVLTAKISSAKTLGTRLNAQIRSPRRESDAQLSMRIQNPARLLLDLYLKAAQDTILTIEQVFVLKAKITNLGSAPIDAGRIKLELPADFTSANGDVVEKTFLLTNEATSIEDSFQVKAPNFDLSRALLRCRMTGVPHDLNSGATAPLVNNGVDSLRVTTARSGLILSNTKISSPNGALLGVVSTLQYITMQTKIEATLNLKNVKVKLEMPSGKGYTINAETPLEREISIFPSTIQWTVRAPDKAIQEPHKFFIQATGQSDLGTKSTRDSVQINSVVSRAQLRLEELTVSSPVEARKDPGGVFSVGQAATLVTKVTNNGIAGVSTGKVVISFGSSGFSLAAGETFEKTFSVGTDIYWNVIAPSTPVTSIQTIEIRLSNIPVDEHTGLAADIFGDKSNDYLYVITNEAGSISISAAPSITAPSGAIDKVLSTGQEFVVAVEISSARVVADEITAKLVFSNKEYKIDLETKKVAIGTKQKVQWTVIAPSTATAVRPDTFYVYASGFDASSPTTTRSVKSTTSLVTIQNKTVFSMRPMIVEPDSNYQYVVSTDEEFTLKTILKSAGAPFNLTDAYVVQMTKPVEFTTTDTLEQKKVGTHPYWRLHAPTKKPEGLSIFRFRLKDVPRDLNSNVDGAIENAEENYSIQVVRRAEVEVTATLSDTAVTTFAPVRIGSIFKVKAYLNNLGEAGFKGTPVYTMELPADYQRVDKAGTDTVSWKVRAPTITSNKPDTIRIKLLTPYPKDQYSQKTVLVKRDSVLVIVKREAGMLVFRPTSLKSNATMIKGASQVSVLSFSLANKDISLNSRSLLDTLQVKFRNKRGEEIHANDVATKISAVRQSDNAILAELTDPPATSLATLNFTTLPADTIKDKDEYHIKLLVDIKADPTALDFQVTLDSAKYIIARDAFSFNRLLIADSTAQQIQTMNFSSGSVVFVDPVFDKSFCNYPNPFGTSGRPLTKFVYYLQEANDLTLKIFTLTGDLVYSWNFTTAEHPQQTRSGLHDGDIVWNGRNGRGQKVMNGVYLAYLQVKNGEQALTKIAVIR